jgi:SAM-dependent methyltransferase
LFARSIQVILRGHVVIFQYLDKHKAIVELVRAFNDDQLAKCPGMPQGVGWNGEPAQLVRYRQLLKVMVDRSEDSTPSLNDVGCGYGALWPMLTKGGPRAHYTGYDVSARMLELAACIHSSDKARVPDFRPLQQICVAEYSIASGLFGMRFSGSAGDWQAYVLDTIDLLDHYSQCGFSFNMLTSYSDPDKQDSRLYYADPCFYFDLCKRKYSKDVALLHDYGLYDFTILVRK